MNETWDQKSDYHWSFSFTDVARELQWSKLKHTSQGILKNGLGVLQLAPH